MTESYKNKPDLRFFLFPSLSIMARLSYYEDRNGNQYTLILPRKRPGFNDMPCNLSIAHAGIDHNCPAVPETQDILLQTGQCTGVAPGAGTHSKFCKNQTNYCSAFLNNF